jgi:hypothetical protein
MIYNCYIYDRYGNNIFYKDWNRTIKPKRGEDDDQKLMFGLLFQLSVFTTQIAPKPSDTFYSFKTDTYKLHYFCSPTKYKFVLLTDISVGNISDILRDLYTKVFIEYAIKNPLQRQYERITCHLFAEQLEKFISSQPFFQ